MTPTGIDALRLELLLAEANLDEARAHEYACWSAESTTSTRAAIAATRARMRAEFIQSTARRRLAEHEPGGDAMSATSTSLDHLKAERDALAAEREKASGARKGILTRQIKQLDAQIAEFEVEPTEPPRETAAIVNSDPTVADRQQVAQSLTPRVGAILARGEKVRIAVLLDAIAEDAAEAAHGDGPREIASGRAAEMGNPVIEHKLVPTHPFPKWGEGRWLSVKNMRTILKRFTELTADLSESVEKGGEAS